MTVRQVLPAVVLSAATLAAAAQPAGADQPYLGFQGTLVKCQAAKAFHVGYRVERVQRGSPAHKMGLECGDVVFRVDNWEFANHQAYPYTLRQADEWVTIRLVNVRNGKIVCRRYRLRHDSSRHSENPPSGIALID